MKLVLVMSVIKRTRVLWNEKIALNMFRLAHGQQLTLPLCFITVDVCCLIPTQRNTAACHIRQFHVVIATIRELSKQSTWCNFNPHCWSSKYKIIKITMTSFIKNVHIRDGEYTKVIYTMVINLIYNYHFIID